MRPLIRRNPEKPPGRRRWLVAAILKQATLTLVLAAAIAFAIGLVLLALSWKVVAFPYRRLEPRRRSVAQKEAVLALAAAAAATLAAFKRARPPGGGASDPDTPRSAE